jgi:hypothetical protein
MFSVFFAYEATHAIILCVGMYQKAEALTRDKHHGSLGTASMRPNLNKEIA